MYICSRIPLEVVLKIIWLCASVTKCIYWLVLLSTTSWWLIRERIILALARTTTCSIIFVISERVIRWFKRWTLNHWWWHGTRDEEDDLRWNSWWRTKGDGMDKKTHSCVIIQFMCTEHNNLCFLCFSNALTI